MTNKLANDTISNTEVTCFNTCEMMHSISYGLNIQVKESKSYIYRGEIGHSALEAYYFELKEGSNPVDARQAAYAVITDELKRVIEEEPEQSEKIVLLTDLDRLIKDYFSFYETEPFRVIDVEGEYRAPLRDNQDYMMRLDLLVEFTSGEFRGDLALFDHKFTYNFKTPAELEMDGQLPKFIKTLRANGYTISKGFFNQLRYREDAKQKFKRDPVRTSTAAMEQIWIEQRQTAAKISLNTRGPDSILGSPPPPVRVMSSIVCKYCDFVPICKASLEGRPTEQIIKANYKQRIRPFKEDDFGV